MQSVQGAPTFSGKQPGLDENGGVEFHEFETIQHPRDKLLTHLMPNRQSTKIRLQQYGRSEDHVTGQKIGEDNTAARARWICWSPPPPNSLLHRDHDFGCIAGMTGQALQWCGTGMGPRRPSEN
jgi:hypothetical protein